MPAFLDFHIYRTVCFCANLRSKGPVTRQGVIYCCCKHSFAMWRYYKHRVGLDIFKACCHFFSVIFLFFSQLKHITHLACVLKSVHGTIWKKFYIRNVQLCKLLIFSIIWLVWLKALTNIKHPILIANISKTQHYSIYLKLLHISIISKLYHGLCSMEETRFSLNPWRLNGIKSLAVNNNFIKLTNLWIGLNTSPLH